MIGEILVTIGWLLAWLFVSHTLTKSERHVCSRCGEILVQGLATSCLYCIRCRRWQR